MMRLNLNPSLRKFLYGLPVIGRYVSPPTINLTCQDIIRAALEILEPELTGNRLMTNRLRIVRTGIPERTAGSVENSTQAVEI